MLHESLGAVLGVKHGQVSEHAHVGSLERESGLEERDQLSGVALRLVEVDECL